MDFSEIIGHENVKRALEIAAVGNFTVLLYGPYGCGKTTLLKAANELHPYSYDIDSAQTPEGFDMARSIRREIENNASLRAIACYSLPDEPTEADKFNLTNFTRIFSPDMAIEVVEQSYQIWHMGHQRMETLEQIQHRVKAARQLFKPVTFDEMKESREAKTSLDLLIHAQKKLHLSTKTVFKVLKVTGAIRALAGETKILPEHVAEAIQYLTEA